MLWFPKSLQEHVLNSVTIFTHYYKCKKIKNKKKSLAFAATVALTKAPKVLAQKVQLRSSLRAAAAAVKVAV